MASSTTIPNHPGDNAVPAPAGSRSAQPSVRAFRFGREVAALMLVATSVFLVLALASFSKDPLVPEAVGANWVGPAGASFAELFVASIGIAAWSVPVELILVALPLLRDKPTIGTAARIGGDTIVILVVAALIHVSLTPSTAFGAMPIGGSVGELFGELLRSLFSVAGSYLVGGTLIVLVLIMRASFSFISFAQRAGKSTERAATHSANGWRAIKSAWQRARDIEKQRDANPSTSYVPAADELLDTCPPFDFESVGAELTPLPKPTKPTKSTRPAKPHTSSAKAQIQAASPAFNSASTTAHGAAPAHGPALDPLSRRSQPSPLSDSDQGFALVSPNDLIDHFGEPSPQAPPACSTQDLVFDSNDCDIALPAATAGPNASTPLANVQAAPVQAPTPAAPAPKRRRTRAPLRVLPTPPAPTSSSSPESTPSPAAAPVETPVCAEPVAQNSAPQAAAEPAAQVTCARPHEPKIVDTSPCAETEKIAGSTSLRCDNASSCYQTPPFDLLDPSDNPALVIDEALQQQLNENADLLVTALSHYGVKGQIREIQPGPTVTTYELEPEAGTKVSKIAGLVDDLAMSLGCQVRIIAPIPGKKRVGFEVPNRKRKSVNLRELIEDRRFQEMSAPLPVVLGRDIVGKPFYADLASMPHVLVAGATGAGKSVGLNVMLVSLLCRRSPEDLRLLMVDPKVVELQTFDRIPHMLLPVVTDTKQAANALGWAVDEMERRYQLLANAGTKNITTYNAWVEKVHAGKVPGFETPKAAVVTSEDGSVVEFGAQKEPPKLPEKLPYIVLVIDEFADLMMQQGKEVEASIARLAQKARAAGMHVILATQRPSVDVITGMIKANFPSRIAFKVTQRNDSRTILDDQGAEHLLGRGDMLVKLNGASDTKRVQCPFVSEEEVERITAFLRQQGEPTYDESILSARDADTAPEEQDAEQDVKYDEAVQVVAETRRCSTSWIQRKLGIGYNRAAKIVEMMEKRGLVGPAQGAKDREVLIDPL